MKDIPKLGFGTYGRTGDAGIAALEKALEVGYRHLDTAQSYDTEKEVGAAVRNSGLARDDVWITTKIDMANYGPGKLAPSLEASIERLGLTPNLTLLHWPSPNGELPLEVYLDQIVEAKARGLTGEIGVSNFPIALLKSAISRAGEGQILTNQFEVNPLHNNHKLARFCQSVGVLVTCYLPIAKGRLAGEPTAEAIAARHGATVEQIALAWELAKGYAAIPTSSRADRIASNFAARDVTLSAEEISALDALPQQARAIDPDWGPDWD
ncbi:aldo/keto reductase [Flavimaricola marinus]|uniref:2,5-diketo-D-gluconic acid reductase B n=1 Tax=Flavimaricola marinus TaxID=1819565 RepID=A0A238L954_9RHOB|nr:aldo/keto reductase [Flavimaricola marinus]SMY06237.1 2,5-diketo-D-gluconic acid reductase B [Flavimaricola marinus]